MRISAAFCLTLMLAACSSYTEPKRILPGPPAYAQEVRVPDPKAGEDVVVVALRERAGRRKANRIIGAMRGDWTAMKSIYAKGK